MERIVGRMQPEAGVATEVAAVVVTSGTSGAPKGVELTWDGLAASAAAISEALEVGAGDRWLACLPLHYVAGLAVVGRAWATGTPVTVLAGFDVAAVAAAADATLVSLVPTMLRRLREAGADTDRFRRILLGGGPVRERGPNIVATYGLTETWGGVVHDGYPLAGVELRLGERRGDPGAGADGDAGLPPGAGGDGRRLHRRRLAAHRRCRHHRRGRAGCGWSTACGTSSSPAG